MKTIENVYRPSQSFLALGDEFSDAVAPKTFPEPRLRWANGRAAARIGLVAQSDADWLERFSDFKPLPDGMPEPRAMRYHGHQFQVYNPDLGDGRGFLYAQVQEQDSNRLLDLATKGSGKTPYSRGGDGCLTLKGAVREVLAAEMLEALGVPTSRAFCVVETGDQLMRNDEPSPTGAAVLTRLGHSHIRFGTFQRHAFERAPDRLEALVDHSLTTYYPALFGEAGFGEAGFGEAGLSGIGLPERVEALLRAVTHTSADLCARWMMAGFIHGVLNTDNMNVTGESFDYGPYRFLPSFEPGFTAAYFDQQGLYAYGRQPDAVVWNLSRLAGALGLLVDDVQSLAPILQDFGPQFSKTLRQHFFWHLARAASSEPAEAERQDELMRQAFSALASSGYGFEAFYYAAGYGDRSDLLPDEFAPVIAQLADYPRLGETIGQPESLLYDEIEAIWSPIDRQDDWQPFYSKVEQIRRFGQALAANKTA